MKNVKPQVGQVWECVKGSLWVTNYGDKAKISKVGNNTVCYNRSTMSAKVFDRCFKFIPQNDLEWLAVNVDVWQSIFNQIFRHEGSFGFCEDSVIVSAPKYTHEQWQNMRYQLGLDDINELMLDIAQKVAVSVEIELSTIKDGREIAESLYKETKMQTIDLSKAVVGDRFLDESDSKQILELILMSESDHGTDYVFRYESTNELLLTKSNGKTENLTHCWITAKIDSRHWLKDLPDADLFIGEVLYLECLANGKWYSHSSGVGLWIGHIKMPKLTGDEWKLSKISIDELRAWQEANK